MDSEPFFEIPYFHDYISPTLARHLLSQARTAGGVANLKEVGTGGGLETPPALQFLTDLYIQLKGDLAEVLQNRILDRKFIDERVRACNQFNLDFKRDVLSENYKTIIGLEDAKGRIILGPLNENYARPSPRQSQSSIAPIPEFLRGPHVTLFGPPDNAKMAVNAMNAFHRQLKNEPQIVRDLLKSQLSVPMWGADDEDSKTPLREDLVSAAVNLTACFNENIQAQEGDKTYKLANSHLAVPIKRFPGLALPCTFLFYNSNPIPLHLYDFALHLFHNWENPRALVFYVPKLENEEEAHYIHSMVKTAEEMIQKIHPNYQSGSVRLMVVLENPRAILRTHEIIDVLHPYFVGASLGWHDFLASTARIFKEDSNYRIPVKADPDIVIKYIKASHLLLSECVGSRGGIKVGGMYGILPLDGDFASESFQVTLKGFFKDVLIQLKRNLTGFWVAHPDFVRLGLAIVEAWKLHLNGNSEALLDLVKALLNAKYQGEVIQIITGQDIQGMDVNNPNYVRSLIVADIKESDFIPNNHPDEIRYNVFQSLQYITDWLCGNGCVALPAAIDGVAVRVMDDLATAERSRWEVWHELKHKRFPMNEFLKIVKEEMLFIRKDLSNDKKIVQVKWATESITDPNGKKATAKNSSGDSNKFSNKFTEKWYPIAEKIMLQLMTDSNPVEFATELMLPFTIDSIRNSTDPWKAIQLIDPNKFKLDSFIEKFNFYFEACGCLRFASQMANLACYDETIAQEIVLNFSVSEIIEAAQFHGDIGEDKRNLDSVATKEQSLVSSEQDTIKSKLRLLGIEYQKKFGFKFLVSAMGKTGSELLGHLQSRLLRTKDLEVEEARRALWEISKKRLDQAHGGFSKKIDALRSKHQVMGASVAINLSGYTQSLSFGEAQRGKLKVKAQTYFQLASLSKPIATCFALEYFKKKDISLGTPVNKLLEKSSSQYRIQCQSHPEWSDMVCIENLLNHTALSMHYVKGLSLTKKMPTISDLISNGSEYGYEPLDVLCIPGKTFHYSGGGFLLLQHLIESLEQKPIEELTADFFSSLELKDITFCQEDLDGKEYAHGYFDNFQEVSDGRFMFPAFAAGALGNAHDTAKFLNQLTYAFNNLDGREFPKGRISHDTAVQMLFGKDKGSREFMGCDVGLGIFVAEAGENKFAIHQGSNEGFRSLFVQCFKGPDCGKGFVVFCNADNRGVLFISQVAQEIFQLLQIQGIDFSRFSENFDFRHLDQEQIVNLGYKHLLFEAFEPPSAEPIESGGAKSPLSEFNLVVDSKIMFVSNDKFARAENLISPIEPVFDPELFGRQGKIMDSWESVRHNDDEFDILRLKLKAPTEIHFLSLSTKFHDGNHPEFVRVLACENSGEWRELLPKHRLEGHSLLKVHLEKTLKVFSQIEVYIYPDGGLTRLGLYKELPPLEAEKFLPISQAKCVRYKEAIPQTQKPLAIPYVPDKSETEANFLKANEVDYASLAFGGKLLSVTNEHYGPAQQVISPFQPLNMFDGMESARSRNPSNYEEVCIQLAKKIKIQRVLLDFEYFVNNNPKSVSIDALSAGNWIPLITKTAVKAFAANKKEFFINSDEIFEAVRVRTYPDGGINRIKVFGV